MVTQLSALLPYALPAILGWAVSYLTALLTKSHLSSGWKLAINTALTIVAAAVATVPYTTGHGVLADLEAYAVALVIAAAANALAYISGGPPVVERATWNRGVGRKVDEAELGFMGKHAADDQSGQPA